jgi:hypothetical protein
MPKPVKKKPATKKKSTTPQRPASDPILRARQLFDEHMGKVDETVTAPHGDPFEAQYKARMSELGRKGGKVSGAKRMEMPAKKRRAIAMKAAKARWSNRGTR